MTNKIAKRLLLVFALAITCCIFAANDTGAIGVEYEQAYNSSDESALSIPETFTKSPRPADVVLDKYKINIYKACKGSDGYRIDWYGNINNKIKCYSIQTFGDEAYGSVYSIATTSDEDKGEKSISGYFVITSPNAATDVRTGEDYDVRMTISNIKVKRSLCDKDDDEYTRTSILYSYGTITKTTAPSWAKPGVSFFTGNSLAGYTYCRSGAKYNVKVRLYYHGTNTQVTGKTMIWAANDIDIGDRTISSGNYYQYDSSHTYAEHIKLINGVENVPNNHLSFVTSDHNKLGFSDNVIYRKISNSSTSSAVDNNSCSTLFKVDMDSFEFEWGGSKCGTTIDSVPFSRFEGKTIMTYDGADAGVTKSVVVNGPTSKKITFDHQIRRIKIGANNPETERFVINRTESKNNTTTRNDDDPGSKTFSGTSTSFVSVATTPNPISGANSVNLEPGETRTFSEQLKYRASDVNEDSDDYMAVERHSITLRRPYAHFNGKITASATKNSNNTSVTISNNAINLTDSDDGHYVITFSNSINRHDTDSDGTAGGTVRTQYSTSYSSSSSVPGASVVTWSPGSSASNVNTAALTDNGDPHSFNVTASGTLKYGETRKICQTLTYVAKQGGGSSQNATNSPYCVTISRPMKKCAVDSSIAYGLISGKNVGQITVKDKELNKTQKTTIGATSSTSIYARPTDNIRFTYDMCAGSLYPIYENNVNKKVWYKASGSITKNPAVTENQSKQYLFRSEVPLVGSTFNNPREWSWQRNVTPASTFLSDSNPSHLEATFNSPSDAVGSNYRCGTPVNGWYQISGKANDGGVDECARTGVYNIGVLDAGSIITQKLEWDEQPVTNSTNVGSVMRTATANVVVPYNYTLKPYVVNNTARAAYIGEKITMYPGVAVMKRTNSTVSSSSYATITKSTSVKYTYYFTDSTGALKGSRQVARADETRRFNKNGSLSSVNETLGSIEIEIDDSHAVGDRVCIELSVAPYDSHNGNDDASAALAEGSNGVARKAVSCISIAKRPTISIESSNAYSATKITTSYYSKKITSSKYVFSSWSEYGVFGHINKDFLMASGAAGGYRRDGYTGGKTLNASRTNPSDDTNVATPENSNVCTFMTQTFANQNCNQSDSAKVIGGVAADLYESRIKERYVGAGKNLVGTSNKSFGAISYIDASNINPNDYYDASANLVGVKSDNIYISKTPTFTDSNSNHTIIYHAGNIVIDGDINKELTQTQTNLSGVTGVVIFANNVYITDAVKYINATIIADNVNTCAFKSASPNTKLEMKDLTSTVCNSSLVFDAPVVAHRLVLNRTAGAGNGANSIVRAEVFNLNTANFLWSFNQMSRYNQAITTYTRELPPRY
ncbi:hypothetical protein IK110_00820 [Candidatus Saccharibacteria bacterium]|nr:hypothetical protein [Candidatus Saccharibacteria bacterium]